MRKYGIGKNKPPKKSRFKKGKSGNPNGRPKGSQNIAIALNQELKGNVYLRENGGVRKKMSKRVALSKTLVAEGLKGNLRAIQDISALERQAANLQRQPDMTIDASDIELLRKYWPYLQNILNRDGGKNDHGDKSNGPLI